MQGVGADSLPGCLGYHGKPLSPNGPCGKCRYEQLCIHVEKNFVPKTSLYKIQRLVQEVRAILKG